MTTKFLSIFIIVGSALMLQACLHKVVTVPVKVAYGTTKGVVKGTTYVVKKAIPGGDEDDK